MSQHNNFLRLALTGWLASGLPPEVLAGGLNRGENQPHN
jgi:hypothetical protein